MIYIKYIGKRKNNKGTSSSWGLFFCEFCETYCEKRLDLGKKYKSCGCNKYSENRNKKIAKKLKEKYSFPENTPMYGKFQTEETKQKIRIKSIGRLHTEETKKIIKEKRKNQIFTKKTKLLWSRQRQGKNNSMYGKRGVETGNWQGGKSFEIYPKEFKQIRKVILERDNYQCQDPNCEGNHKKLCIHHIDFDKKNNSPENLITLCSSCHTKTNGKNNRHYFTEFYQSIIVTKLTTK